MSTTTTPASEASTESAGEMTTTMLSQHEEKSYRRRALERAHDAATSQDILLFLIAFRILNALSIRTFFQPDEYFQSLEPAWEMAFGADSGAWITWEWKHRLRSAIHPAMFAAVYRLASFISQRLQLSPSYHADLMIATPKILQAVFAALGDYYTWKMGEKIYESKRPTESPRLILRAVGIVACPNGLQSLAMVLFHAHTVQLRGDDSHHHCSALMAVALMRVRDPGILERRLMSLRS
ncbi:MAG: hypothetical protein LQ347_003683 [Umbilicaria vellea]|nr:MAG: hypothetical protein LQ347_003683 [Umbilicaria vellea]